MYASRGPATFAVVITSYNYRRYVEEAIESALAQSRPPARIVVTDDASTDGSADFLVARYGNDPRITLDLATENGGQLASFMRGVALCREDVVCFLDSDDYWLPDHLEKLGAFYDKRRDVDFVFTDLQRFGEDDGRETFSESEQDLGFTALMMYRSPAYYGSSTSGLSLRRGLAQRSLDVPAELVAMWRLYGDAHIIIASSIYGAHKYYLPTGTVRYRIHGSNAQLRNQTPERRYRLGLASRATANYCARRIGIEPNCFAFLAEELATKPAPSAVEIARYRHAIAAEMGALKMLRRRVKAFFGRTDAGEGTSPASS